MKLLDANVWVAASWGGHSKHHIVRDWLDGQLDELAWCRVTQMAFLRLVSNPAVAGSDSRTRREAWDSFHAFAEDPRVRFLAEPDGLLPLWLSMSKREDRRHQLWTDDYLAAFTQAAGATFVTFDAAVPSRYPSVSVTVLR